MFPTSKQPCSSRFLARGAIAAAATAFVCAKVLLHTQCAALEGAQKLGHAAKQAVRARAKNLARMMLYGKMLFFICSLVLIDWSINKKRVQSSLGFRDYLGIVQLSSPSHACIVGTGGSKAF